jgi:XTP/dITP diphosphohydrolase
MSPVAPARSPSTPAIISTSCPRLRGIALRTARYRCALALARDREVLLTAEGFVDGEILTAPRGTGGFGYDPLFFLPQFRLTMAEISLEQKNAVSHRGRALRALLPGLRKLIS